MRVCLRRFAVLLGGVFLSVNAFAGPGAACVGATLSANQQVLVLVLNAMTVDDPDASHIQHVTGSTFQILLPVQERNTGLRMSGPDRYWDGTVLWSVHLPSKKTPEISGCPYVLVTDDAEFLVVLEDGPPLGAGLLIHRRRVHPGEAGIAGGPDLGVFIGSIPKAMFVPDSFSKSTSGWNDHSPEWYSFGRWSFSADNRALIFERPQAPIVKIDLATGTILK